MLPARDGRGGQAHLGGKVLAALRAALTSRAELVVENIALRQQIAVLKAKRPRPPLRNRDRLFWIALRRLWSRWADGLLIAKPETVIPGASVRGWSPHASTGERW